jgi:hypothetical protein
MPAWPSRNAQPFHDAPGRENFTQCDAIDRYLRPIELPCRFGRADETDGPISAIQIPAGYRDWRLISVAHEAGNLNDIRAVLGNDAAIEAYRKQRLPLIGIGVVHEQRTNRAEEL